MKHSRIGAILSCLKKDSRRVHVTLHSCLATIKTRRSVSRSRDGIRCGKRKFRFSDHRVSNFFSRIGLGAHDAWSRNSVSEKKRKRYVGREKERERENGRGNEHWFQGENIALFRNRANGYCGPFTGRQAAVSLYLIGWRGGKKRRGVNWRTLDRRTLKYSSALRHLRNPGWRCWMEETVSFLLLFILLISFLFSFFFFYSGLFWRGWVNWLGC